MARRKKPTDPTCDWTLDVDYEFYDTDCGQAFQFSEGTPAENLMLFCCYCGRKLRAAVPDPQESR